MFDKGCTFLAIFGMPGEKNENDPARALRAARHIFIHLQEQGIRFVILANRVGIDLISLFAASVAASALRREKHFAELSVIRDVTNSPVSRTQRIQKQRSLFFFLVIGSSVNLAARLMMAFSGNVVCDEKTMKTSGLNTKLFREAEPKTPLKGISDAGKLYFYSTDIQ